MNGTVCQQELETLAGGSSWVGASPRDEETAPSAALRLAMAELRGETMAFAEETAVVEEGPLHFLAPPEKPGTLGRFGPYDVIAFLGGGGMGLVFKAFDPALSRFVALKVLAPQLATSPTARRRFAREARAAAAIRHEHVVAIFEVNSSGGLPYLVMQYVPGLSLQQRLDREGRLPLEEVVRIGQETAAGLAAAHACGLVHRDVKPANILLEEGSGHVWLTDFGLARAGDDTAVTQSGYLAGTPQYMAPEQARGEPIDHRADLFSLGSVLYALCTGRPPFQADSTLALLRRVSDEAPPPVRTLNPNVPDWLVEIMTCLHSKSPARRFQSAAAVARLLGDHRTRMHQEPTPQPAPTPPRRRRPALVALLALLLTILTATETAGLTHLVQWAATVLRVRTPEGTLVVRVDDPAIEVTVDGSEVQIRGDGIAEVHVRAGKHEVKATRKGKVVERKLVEIHRDDKVVVRVSLEPAAPAQARKKETKPAPATWRLGCGPDHEEPAHPCDAPYRSGPPPSLFARWQAAGLVGGGWDHPSEPNGQRQGAEGRVRRSYCGARFLSRRQNFGGREGEWLRAVVGGGHRQDGVPVEDSRARKSWRPEPCGPTAGDGERRHDPPVGCPDRQGNHAAGEAGPPH
jgi:serine/threonine protein kinase